MSSAAFALTANGGRREQITQASVQKMLDENTSLIQTIIEYQNQGNARESIQYQQLLHRNLIFLATLADSTLNQQQQQQQNKPAQQQNTQQQQQTANPIPQQQPSPAPNQQQQAVANKQSTMYQQPSTMQQPQTSQQQQLHQHYQQQAAMQQQALQQQQLQQHLQQQHLRNNALNNSSPNQAKNSMPNSPSVSTNSDVKTNAIAENGLSGRSTPVTNNLPISSAQNQPTSTTASNNDKPPHPMSNAGYQPHHPGMPQTSQMHPMHTMSGMQGNIPPPFMMSGAMSNGATPEMIQSMLLQQQQMARAAHEAGNFHGMNNMPPNSMPSNNMPPSTGF